jgi:hypothetical protein
VTPGSAPPAIQLVYGPSQQFRLRCRDVTVLGHVEAAMPLRRSGWQLNDGPILKNLGDFKVEIPVDGLELREGDNRLVIEIEDRERRVERLEEAFVWDPAPVPLPLDLGDLSKLDHIQQVGQAVSSV